jgi:hypothetical protein
VRIEIDFLVKRRYCDVAVDRFDVESRFRAADLRQSLLISLAPKMLNASLVLCDEDVFAQRVQTAVLCELYCA